VCLHTLSLFPPNHPFAALDGYSVSVKGGSWVLYPVLNQQMQDPLPFLSNHAREDLANCELCVRPSSSKGRWYVELCVKVPDIPAFCPLTICYSPDIDLSLFPKPFTPPTGVTSADFFGVDKHTCSFCHEAVNASSRLNHMRHCLSKPQ
jgi:hypothetical protein